MKLKLLSILLLAAIAGFSQTLSPTDPLNIWGVGVSWNQSAQQQVAGTLLYAREQTAAGTYAFGVIDAVPTAYKPLTVVTNLGVGVGQKILSINGWSIYATVAAGPSWSGQSTGWNWTGGGIATHAIKGKWWGGLNARVVKSSVNNNSGSQFIFGVLAGMNP